jgi:hypothetical protein
VSQTELGLSRLEARAAGESKYSRPNKLECPTGSSSRQGPADPRKPRQDLQSQARRRCKSARPISSLSERSSFAIRLPRRERRLLSFQNSNTFSLGRHGDFFMKRRSGFFVTGESRIMTQRRSGFFVTGESRIMTQLFRFESETGSKMSSTFS